MKKILLTTFLSVVVLAARGQVFDWTLEFSNISRIEFENDQVKNKIPLGQSASGKIGKNGLISCSIGSSFHLGSIDKSFTTLGKNDDGVEFVSFITGTESTGQGFGMSIYADGGIFIVMKDGDGLINYGASNTSNISKQKEIIAWAKAGCPTTQPKQSAKQSQVRPPASTTTSTSQPTPPAKVEPVEETGQIYDTVEEKAQYPGGEVALNEWLAKNLKYPAIAEEEGITGRVLVQFVVNISGALVEPKVLKTPDPSLSKEALRLVKAMPLWQPAKIAGKAVRSRVIQPINFQL